MLVYICYNVKLIAYQHKINSIFTTCRLVNWFKANKSVDSVGFYLFSTKLLTFLFGKKSKRTKQNCRCPQVSAGKSGDYGDLFIKWHDAVFFNFLILRPATNVIFRAYFLKEHVWGKAMQFQSNQGMQSVNIAINTYWLRTRKTVCFVPRDRRCFSKRRLETTKWSKLVITYENSWNILFLLILYTTMSDTHNTQIFSLS